MSNLEVAMQTTLLLGLPGMIAISYPTHAAEVNLTACPSDKTVIGGVSACGKVCKLGSGDATPSSGSTSSSGSSSSGTTSSSGATSSSLSSSGTVTSGGDVVNGACGTAENQTLSSAPTAAASLCSAGTPSTVTSNGIAWGWQCDGINGGVTAGCDALQGSNSSGGSGGSCNPTVLSSGDAQGGACQTYNNSLGACATAGLSSPLPSGICYGQIQGGGPCSVGNPQTTAMRASDFIDSLGVNTHMESTDPSANYTDATLDLSEAQYLGIHNFRCYYNTTYAQNYVTVAQGGIRFDFLVYDGGAADASYIANQLSAIDNLAEAVPGSVIAVEGPNEVGYPPDSNSGSAVTFNGETDYQAAINFQQSLYQQAHADTNLPNIVVYNFTQPTPQTPSPQTQPGYADFDTAHPYPNSGMPPLEGDMNDPSFFDPLISNTVGQNETPPYGPVVYTETGYGSIATNPEAAVGDIELLLDDAQMGVNRTYIYQEQEDGLDFGLGLMNNGNPTSAAAAIHNLTTIMNDTNTAANTTCFTPTMLNYSINPLPSLGHAWLMQKSNGTFELAIWAESNWDGGTDNMTVSLGMTATTVNIYDPIQSTTPIQTLNNVSTVPLSLGMDPLIIEVIPGP